MFCVYLLESLSTPGRRYVGFTTDLKQRFDDHNAGKSSHTAKFKPWRLVTYDYGRIADRSHRLSAAKLLCQLYRMCCGWKWWMMLTAMRFGAMVGREAMGFAVLNAGGKCLGMVLARENQKTGRYRGRDWR